MYKRNVQGWLKHLDFILLDAIVLQISFVIAYIIRHGWKNPYEITSYRTLAIVLVIVDILVSVLFNTMHNVLRRGPWNEFVQTLKQCALVLVIMTLYMFSVQTGDIYSRITIYLTAGFHLILGYLTRLAWKPVVRNLNKARPKRTMILVADEACVEGIMSLSAHSRLFRDNTRASGHIPQIAAIMGNCAGGSAYSPAMCDFIFMVDKTGQFFITGPKVIKAMLGMDVTMEELGGASIHSQISGQAHFVYQDDLSCIEGIKQLLGYVTVREVPYTNPENTDYKALGKEIENIVPEDKQYPYDVREVIKRLVDNQDYMEVSPDFARNLVTCFARISGKSIGIVANQANYYGGALDCDAADKCARFVRFCDCFNIPLLTLVDVPGFFPGVEQEQKGILRHGSKILFAYAEATVPQVSIVLRKAYGGAYCAMGSKALSSDIAFAWPICEFAVMGAGGAVDVIYHKQLEESENPAELRAELIRKYEEKYLDPYFAATCGMIDEVIMPEETREKIIAAFKSLEDKKVEVLSKKHGNISL